MIRTDEVHPSARPERCGRIARDLALVLAAPTAEELADRTRPPRITSLSVDPEVILEGGKVSVTIGVENCDYASVTFPGSDEPREFDGSGPLDFCAVTTGLVTVHAVNALNPEVTATAPVRVELIPRFDLSALELPDVPILSGAQIGALASRFETLHEESLNLHALATGAVGPFGSSSSARDGVVGVSNHLTTLSETAVEAARARAVALGRDAAWRDDQPITTERPVLPAWARLTRGQRRTDTG